MDLKPIIGITMGDAAGIGPEVIVKALLKKEIREVCRPVVIGNCGVLQRVLDITGLSLKINPLKNSREAVFEDDVIDVVYLNNLQMKNLKIGEVNREAGRAAVEYVREAVRLALRGDIHAITTAPLNKEAMNEAGFHYEGHTDMLAKLTGTRNFAMMLRGASLCAVLVTVHVPIKKVPSLVTEERVLMVLKLTHKFFKKFLKKSPTLAVAALNPHCGEGGIFGREEAQVLTPAITKAKRAGLKCSGPYPPDTVFRRAVSGEFDAVICMYHDQALIPMKLLAFDCAVNITLGLPVIRTSPAHGTAYDIAWRNLADSRSLEEAIKFAAQLAGMQN